MILTSIDGDITTTREARNAGARAFVNKADLPNAPMAELLGGEESRQQITRYGCAMSEPLRVVIGEDDVLLREGIARLLTEAGFEVVAQAGDAGDLLRKGLAHRPSVVIADVNMPPEHRDDGLRAAIEVRQQRPETGVLVLSQFYDERYALDPIGDRAEGVGYLLKERMGGGEFVDTVTRVAAGGSALDPEIVGRMLGRRQRDRPLDRLTSRERDVLAAMAEGKSNHGIAQALLVSQAAVEKHVTSIFHKLECYVSWREACHVVRLAYQRWAGADRHEHRLAYAGYLASIDQEEWAARAYADQIERVRRIST